MNRTEQPVVSVVIPTRNRAELMMRTLDSVLAQKAPSTRLEIHVVDNGSTDDTAKRIAGIQAQSPVPVRYHRMTINGGPAASRNYGALRSTGEFILFVDSDVELDADWIKGALNQFQQDPALGMVTGKVVFASNPAVIHCFGGAMSIIGLGWDAHQGEDELALQANVRKLWTPSATLMLRRQLFETLGGFDESYFYGYEDSDLGWRYSLAGWHCLCLSSVAARHATTGQIDDQVKKVGSEVVYHYSKNRLRMLLKNYGWRRLLSRLPQYLTYALGDAVLRAPRASKWRALWWNLTHLPETWRLRRRVQAQRRVPDRYLDPLIESGWFPPQPLARRLEQVRHLHGPANSIGGAPS